MPGAGHGDGAGPAEGGREGPGFIAMLLTERYVAGRSMNSLVTGLARQGAEISPATLAGTCAQAGTLLVPLADAIAARSRVVAPARRRDHLAGVFAPRDGTGPAKWWLWVFTAPRGAVSYRSRSGQGWEEVSLDLMAYSGPKG